MRLVFSPEFRDRLNDLFVSIREQSGSFSAANKVVTDILSRISILESYPDAGMHLYNDDGKDTGVMLLILGRYIATYRRAPDTVMVTNLLDTRTEEFARLKKGRRKRPLRQSGFLIGRTGP